MRRSVEVAHAQFPRRVDGRPCFGVRHLVIEVAQLRAAKREIAECHRTVLGTGCRAIMVAAARAEHMMFRDGERSPAGRRTWSRARGAAIAKAREAGVGRRGGAGSPHHQRHPPRGHRPAAGTGALRAVPLQPHGHPRRTEAARRSADSSASSKGAELPFSHGIPGTCLTRSCSESPLPTTTRWCSSMT